MADNAIAVSPVPARLIRGAPTRLRRSLPWLLIGMPIAAFAIWAIVSLTTGSLVHPWWLYVAAPPGAILGVLYAAGIGRPES